MDAAPAVERVSAARTAGLRRRRRVLRAVLVTMLAVFILIAGYGLLVFRPGIVLHTANPVMSGTSTAGAVVGARLPTISGVDYDGNAVTVGPDGEPVTIVVIAHWCEYCKAEIQDLHAAMLAGTYVPSESLVAISTRHLPFVSWPPKEALKLEDFPGKVIVDTDSSLASYFDIRTTPTWYFTDARGVIRKVVTGTLSVQQITDYAHEAQQPV